ncbi:MAG: hypothetical protein ACJ8AT_04055 [Hyalangium sp.]
MLDRLRGAKGPHREALLLELGNTGEPSVIPELVRSLLPVAVGSELRALALALHHLTSSLGSEEARAVEEALRWPGWSAVEYQSHTPRDMTRYTGLPPVVFALLSCHPDGYVREAALRGLHGRDAGPAWPFLLLRINDWVRPVREAALATAEEALPRLAPEWLVRHLPLLLRLRTGGRANHETFVEHVLERLRAPEGRGALHEHLDTLKGPAWRMTYQLLAEGDPQNAPALLERALEGSDTAMQCWAAHHVADVFHGEALRELLARMEHSRLMPVRREAYVLYVQRIPELAGPKLREALLDRHPAIREYAQRRLSGADLAGFYRESLQEGPRLHAALAGLGETGRAPDATSVEPFLHHSKVRVRREAVRAYSKLAGNTAEERMRECFVDPAPSVSRAAAAELRRQPGWVSAPWLRRWFAPETPPHLSLGALQLSDVLSKWDAPLVPLAAMGAANPALAERALRQLKDWLARFNQDFTQPTRPQLQALKALVDTTPGLESALQREFAHLLQAFGPL